MAAVTKSTARAARRTKPPLADIPVVVATTRRQRHRLSRTQVAAFEAELTAIYHAAKADIGERDARHIRKMVRVAQGSAIAGRSLLMFGFGPLSFVAGVAALANAKILENMEVGHNVMHGQYDWMNDPRFASQTYDWDNVCDGEDWRHSHNVMHHNHTNIIGLDKDLGYGVLRMDGDTPWKPRHLLNPINNALLALLFQYGVGAHDADIAHWLKSSKDERKEILRKMKPFVRKIGKQWFKDYALFPVIGFWNAPRIFVGNVSANLIRNLWSYAIIFCGHFPEGTQTFTQAETANETKGDWYIRQLLGSANIEGSKLMHVMSGHLSHQIEHHLFPDLPAHRYVEIGPQVRGVVENYGLPYNTGSFARQLGTVMKKVFRYALPAPGAKLDTVALAA